MNQPNGTRRSKPSSISSDVGPFAMTPAWVLRDETLSPTAKALYGLLMLYADQESRSCYPSHARLARELGSSRRTIMRALAGLESRGALTIKRRRLAHGGQTSSLYVLRALDPLCISDTPLCRYDTPPCVTDAHELEPDELETVDPTPKTHARAANEEDEKSRRKSGARRAAALRSSLRDISQSD